MLQIKQQKGQALRYHLALVPVALVIAAQAESQGPHGEALLSIACPAQHLPPTQVPYIGDNFLAKHGRSCVAQAGTQGRRGARLLHCASQRVSKIVRKRKR